VPPRPRLLRAVGAGNVEGGLDFANMLKPALGRSQLQVRCAAQHARLCAARCVGARTRAALLAPLAV
jgi:hypothetical protein